MHLSPPLLKVPLPITIVHSASARPVAVRKKRARGENGAQSVPFFASSLSHTGLRCPLRPVVLRGLRFGSRPMLRIENYYYVCMCFTGLPRMLGRLHNEGDAAHEIPAVLDPASSSYKLC
jgi:hypothetical protein